MRDESIDPQNRNFYPLSDFPLGDDAESGYEPSIAPSIGPVSNEQPEQEISPPMSNDGGGGPLLRRPTK